MLAMLVVTHGRLAEELVHAARTIVGPVERMEALSIGWHTAVAESSKSIEAAIDKLDDGDGVVVLTDMFGGTPTNLSASLHEKGKIEIITGVNLPMLIKFANLRGEPGLHEAAGKIAEQGRQAIHVASDLLETHEEVQDNA